MRTVVLKLSLVHGVVLFEANSSSYGQEMSRVLWNQNSRYRVRSFPPLNLIVSHFNREYNLHPPSPTLYDQF